MFSRIMLNMKKEGIKMIQNEDKIGAIILAAGQSRRMGIPKVLLRLNGKPLFLYACELAIDHSLHPIVVIGGKYSDLIQNEVKQYENIITVHNPDYEKGMSTSLRLGVDILTEKVDATLIFLADQPLIPKLVVQSVLTCYSKHKNAGVLIVRPSFNGKDGHPVLFSSKLFPQFSSIQGDEGGKQIVKKFKKQTAVIPFYNSYIGLDIDTPADYRKVKEIFKRGF